MRLVAGYAIYDAIGSGGTARVHLACRSEGSFVRVVATKHLREDRDASAETVTMLADEARLASRIRHPNVVTILDVVEEGQELVLVQEYVHGASLAQLHRGLAARGSKMPPAIASAIAVGILDGLHAAHVATDQGGSSLELVHRDVTPQNIIVGADGLARVLDFGMAKARGRSTRTATGVIKGKLAYMAPEQLRGKALSARTDVWAAGVLLWEMLTAKRLFAGSEEEIVERIGLGDVSPPSRFAPEADVLDHVVLRALSSAADDRWASADAMARAIETALPPAYPSAVEAWVTEIAGEDLRVRSALIAHIEQQERARSEGAGDTKVDARPAKGPETSPDGADTTPPQRRTPWSALALLTLLLASVAMLLMRPAGAPGASASTTVPSSATASYADAAAPAEPANEANEAELVAKGAAVPSPPQAAHRATRPRPRPTAVPAPDPCAIPYVLDSMGRKTYKRECLR